MSIIILLPKGSATTTTDMAFRARTDHAVSGDARFVVSDFAKPVHPDVKRSPRTGKLPLNVSQYKNELDDESYRKRMEAARAALADDMQEVGAKPLATLRLKRGLSQSQLAQRIGTSQPHIAKIEAGSVSPTWLTVVKIADALSVSLDALRPLIQVETRVETKSHWEAEV